MTSRDARHSRIHNPRAELCAVVAVWLRDVLATTPAPPRTTESEGYGWEADADGTRYWNVEQHRSQYVMPEEVLEGILSLETFQAVVSLFERHVPDWRDGRMAIVPHSGVFLTPMVVVGDLWDEVDPWQSGWEARLTEFCDKVGIVLFDKQVKITITWPLPALRLSTVPLRLDENFVIDALTPDEVVSALNRDLWPHEYDGTAMAVEPRCLRYEEFVDKTVAGFGADLPGFPDSKALWQRFSLAWRLTRGERLEPLGSISDAPWGFGETNVRTPRPFGDLDVVADSLDELRAIWGLTEDSRVQRRLGVGLRRFLYSIERTRVEDRLVDLIVAAEALYLGDEAGTELGYRLALRAVALFGDDRFNRYRFFRAAYTVRSKLMHGAVPRSSDLPLPTGDVAANLEAFTDALENEVRRAYRRAMSAIASGQPEMDWERLVLGDARTRESH